MFKKVSYSKWQTQHDCQSIIKYYSKIENSISTNKYTNKKEKYGAVLLISIYNNINNINKKISFSKEFCLYFCSKSIFWSMQK